MRRQNYGGGVGRAFALALCAGGAAGVVRAGPPIVTSEWLNPVDGIWTDAAMWSTPQYPNFGVPVNTLYRALIDASGAAYTVTLMSDVHLHGMTIDSDDATLHISNGRLRLDQEAEVLSGRLRVSGPSALVYGVGDLVIGGTMEWERGDIVGGSELRILSTGNLIVDDRSNGLRRTLRNEGTVEMLGSEIELGNLGGIINDGVIVANGLGNSVRIRSFFEGTALVNNGLISLLGGSMEFDDGVEFINYGTLRLASNGGGFFERTVLEEGVYNSGAIVVEDGAELWMRGSSTYLAGSSLQNAGVIWFASGVHDLIPGVYSGDGLLGVSGGSVTLYEAPTSLEINSGSVTFQYFVDLGSELHTGASLTFNGGVALAPGADVTLLNGAAVDLGAGDRVFGAGDIDGTLGVNGNAEFTDGLIWRGGALSGPGVTTLGPGSALTLTGGDKTLARTLDTSVSTVWTGGDIALDGGTLIVRGDLVSNGDHSVVDVGAGGAFHNLGAVLIESGSMGLLTATQNDGSIHVASGATLRVGGAFEQGDTGTVLGEGAVDFTTGSVTLAKGVFETSGPMINSGADVTVGAGVSPSSWQFLGGSTRFLEDQTFGAQALEGGSIGGPVRLTFDSLHWEAGSLLADVEAEVSAGGSLTFGDAGSARTLAGALRNNGDAALDSGTLSISGGLFENAGTMSIAGGALVRAAGGAGTFVNLGVVQSVGQGVVSIDGSGMSIVNQGTVQIGAGTTLRLGGNIAEGDFGQFVGPGSLQFVSGQIYVPTGGLGIGGGVSMVGGDVTFESQPLQPFAALTGGTARFLSLYDAGSQLSVAGTVMRFEGGLALDEAGAIHVFGGGVDTAGQAVAAGMMQFNSGLVEGDADLTIGSSLVWLGGAMRGAGRTILAEGATATIGAFHPLTLGREFVNRGEASISTQFFRLEGGTFRNEGTLLAGNFATLVGLAGGGTLINEGVILKELTGQFRLQAFGGVMRLQNTGLVDVREGLMQIDADERTINDGTYRAAHAGAIEVVGDFTNGSQGALEFEVGGIRDRGLSGLMTITGEASLAGTLSVTTPEGFEATWGDRWVVMSYGSVEGDFDVFDLPTEGFASRSDDFGASDLRWYAERGETEYAVGVSHIADIDHDGLIGFGDLNIIASNFNAFGSWAAGDVDGDGFVGFTDLNVVLGLFNVAAPRSVPAPGAAALLAMAGLAGRRRQRG